MCRVGVGDADRQFGRERYGSSDGNTARERKSAIHPKEGAFLCTRVVAVRCVGRRPKRFSQTQIRSTMAVEKVMAKAGKARCHEEPDEVHIKSCGDR